LAARFSRNLVPGQTTAGSNMLMVSASGTAVTLG
jgi:uncharacterized protein YbjQ (UPF0145 family)